MISEEDIATLNLVSVPVFVLQTGAEGSLVYAAVNDAWCNEAKRKREEVLNKTAVEVFSGKLGVIACNHHTRVAGMNTQTTYDLMLPLGSEAHSVRTALMPRPATAQESVVLFETSMCGTYDIKPAELRVKLKAVTSEIEDYIALAAHDLRTPMRNISVLAAMLREDFEDKDDTKLELVDMLEHVATKASLLISDVLSHAQATNLDDQQSSFDLGQLCADIFTVLDPLNTQDFTAQTCEITADKTAVQIVLRNLLDNAIKHSDRDTVRMSVTARAGTRGLISFSVQDNGDGFKDPAIAFLGGGTMTVDSGFGLLGIRRLIQARGGSISVANLEGGTGSIVEFSLPGFVAKQDSQMCDTPILHLEHHSAAHLRLGK